MKAPSPHPTHLPHRRHTACHTAWLGGLLALVLTFGCATPTPAADQKKQLATAKENIKKGNNLENAEKTVVGLLADSANRQNPKVWTVLFDALKKQYDQGNEKIYLKQKYDTATLFNIASRMFRYMEAFDSIDAQPDEKGRVRLTMRKDNAALLNRLRPNLLSGGHYFVKKQKFADAYRLFDLYVGSAEQPLFAAYQYAEKDKTLAEASYWAVYCAYKNGDTRSTLHHTYLALKDTAHYEMMLQYLAETYRRDADTARYVQTLTEGFGKYPRSMFFFSNLIEHYAEGAHWNEALALTDKALRTDSTSQAVRLTKSAVLLNMGRYAECFDICQALIARGDTVPEAWLNAGLAKYNLGVGIDKKTRATAKQRAAATAYYAEARPYMEKYRSLRPDRKDKWALPLYTIYLNLNMGKEFDEIDKLMDK